MSVRELIIQRSGGRCEAMVGITPSGWDNTTWTRCLRMPIEIHHKLTRARGGLLLDEIGETYHLAAYCHQHHKDAHDEGSAISNGLLIDGYVTTQGKSLKYTGTDPYLNDNYYGRGVEL